MGRRTAGKGHWSLLQRPFHLGMCFPVLRTWQYIVVRVVKLSRQARLRLQLVMSVCCLCPPGPKVLCLEDLACHLFPSFL